MFLGPLAHVLDLVLKVLFFAKIYLPFNFAMVAICVKHVQMVFLNCFATLKAIELNFYRHKNSRFFFSRKGNPGLKIRHMLQKYHLGCILKVHSFSNASILQNCPIFGHLQHYLDLASLHNISNIFGSYAYCNYTKICSTVI